MSQYPRTLLRLGSLACLITALFLLFTPWQGIASPKTDKTAVILDVNSAIGPATAEYIRRGIDYSAKQDAALMIIQLDTPGGLDKAMREIIKNIINAPLPIVTYVAPSGAHAASAGTYILYASQIAAMAPGTNLGAATPVQMGGMPGTPAPEAEDKQKTDSNQEAMSNKVRNDALAYITSLAEMRGRNAEWAREAVLDGASISAEQALKLKVIDVIAPDIKQLLSEINGRQVDVQGQARTIASQGLVLDQYKPDWRIKFLAVITSPTVAYMLLLLGIYGIFFEFLNPGFVLPGVVGAIAILIALYAFHLLPINYVGLGLIILGIIFMVAEALVPSFGALGFGGIIAFLVGSILLIDTTAPGFGIPLSAIIAMAVINGLFVIFIVGMAIRARRRPVVTGFEALIGCQGRVMNSDDGHYRVMLNGELWLCHSEYELSTNQLVEVISVDGLTLTVIPIVK
ncbi:MAG: serine protease [Legionellales bacterium]|nr:serine protease [Legionellales bacterium]